MPEWRTDCVGKPLSKVFGKFGRVIGKYPWPFFIFPLVISAGLSAGFYFLEDRELNSIEGQFTPKYGPAKTERQFVKEYFPQTGEFSSLRLNTDGTYASIIAVRSTNIFTQEAFQEIVDLDSQVKGLQTDDDHFVFSDLCAKRKNGECTSNPILDIMNSSFHNGETISYPFHTANLFNREFIGDAIGGVSQHPNNSIETANAIRLFYYLVDNRRNETDIWLRKFISTFAESKSHKHLSLAYFTSLSREEELNTNIKTVIPFIVPAFIVVIIVVIVFYLRQDCVRNKVWLSIFGMLSVGLAVLSSFGLVLLCRMPFVMTLITAPFLIFEVGVDDIAIMKSCWQKTDVDYDVEDRMEDTYKQAAVSITITTLTDVLAFYIGLMMPFGSVQSFCMYTGTALLFCSFYNITFFGAFMALNGRREESNRHWFTCRVVDYPDENKKSNACSVGGAWDCNTNTEEDGLMDRFFQDYYGPFITNPWTKVFVVLLYAGYLAGSIYGCFQMQVGLQLNNLAPDDSYVANYYENEQKYFSEYGPLVMLIIKNESFQYWEESAHKSLSVCLKDFESSDMVGKNMTISWLESYEVYRAISHVRHTHENEFMDHLHQFLNLSGFSQDVNITDGKILASRFFIPSVNISSTTDEKDMLIFFRNTALNCNEYLDVLVYHPAFIYLDQYNVMYSNILIANVVASAVVLLMYFLLIPNPLCSLWVTFATASSIVGVTGFMALWNVHLDSISMINYAVCICLSVDFSAHISYAFASSNETTSNDKAVDALYRLGWIIVEGAVLSIVSAFLTAVKSYIFRTIFKIMFLAILFGALHGIMFIPVFLSFLCCMDSKDCEETHSNTSNENICRAVNQSTSSEA